MEDVMETALAEIAVDNKGALAALSKRDSEVARDEAFTFGSKRGSDKDGMEAFIDAGELKVGAKRFDTFSHSGLWIALNNEFIWSAATAGTADIGLDNLADYWHTDAMLEIFGVFNGIVEVIDNEGDSDDAEDGDEAGDNDVTSKSIIGRSSVNFGVFIRADVIEAGEFGDFFGEDLGGAVGDVASALWVDVGDGNFEDLSVGDVSDGDILSELFDSVVEVELVDDLLKNFATLHEFAISSGELLVSVDVAKRGASVLLVLLVVD